MLIYSNNRVLDVFGHSPLFLELHLLYHSLCSFRFLPLVFPLLVVLRCEVIKREKMSAVVHDLWFIPPCSHRGVMCVAADQRESRVAVLRDSGSIEIWKADGVPYLTHR